MEANKTAARNGVAGSLVKGAQFVMMVAGPGKFKAALPSARTMDHHLFPRQFNKYFKSKGINIDQHTVTWGEKTHLKGIHGNGLGNMPGGWNKIWQNFIEKNSNATTKEVYQQLGRMMDDFSLSGSRIHPYQKND